VNLRRLRVTINLVLFGVLGTLLILANPVYSLATLVSVFALFLVFQQLNFYKIVMMLKHAALTLSKLRHNIRVQIHLGLQDSRVSGLSDEKKSHRTYGHIQ
jgi:hypothetical protein